MVPGAPRPLIRWSGVAALVGAAMWAYKSGAILLSGRQPDHWFELALVCFGLSVILLVGHMRTEVSRPRAVAVFGWMAAIAGAASSAIHLVDGDEGLFGPAALVTTLSTVGVMFLVGGDVIRGDLLPRYNFAPRLLGWLYVVAIPVGGILSGIDERLLEIGLLGVVTGWVFLGLGSLARVGPT